MVTVRASSTGYSYSQARRFLWEVFRGDRYAVTLFILIAKRLTASQAAFDSLASAVNCTGPAKLDCLRNVPLSTLKPAVDATNSVFSESVRQILHDKTFDANIMFLLRVSFSPGVQVLTVTSSLTIRRGSSKPEEWQMSPSLLVCVYNI